MSEMQKENKLQIRAKLLSAIANLLNSQNKEQVNQQVEELSQIQDKSAVLEILKKEFLKDNTESRDFIISFLLRTLLAQDVLENAFFEDLINPKINDETKAKVVNFLREIGKHVNYDEYISYFENPDEIIDTDTEKLLENAKINPEAQIDFLDFLTALPDSEKEMLVTSLSQDYDGDNLTNILVPVIMSNPYSELSQSAISAIGESKSKLAYPALLKVYEIAEDQKIRANVQKSLNLLKLSGIKEDLTKDYYKKILGKSPINACYLSFPDGHGNIGLIFSRKTESGFIQMFALVMNDIDGIIDCFGFNEISEQEFERIVDKFYQNNKVIEADAVFCKYLMENAEKITRLKFEAVSYEYIAWKSITNDIDYAEIDLKQQLNTVELNEFLMKQIYEQGYFDRWFFEKNDNTAFSAMMENIINKKICDTKLFESEIQKNKQNIFDSAQVSILNNRLILSSYMAKLDGEEIASSILYSLTQECPYRESFLTDYLKKSVYQYFLAQKDRYESIKNATSIFARKANQELNEIDIKYIKQCIKNIEEVWI